MTSSKQKRCLACGQLLPSFNSCGHADEINRHVKYAQFKAVEYDGRSLNELKRQLDIMSEEDRDVALDIMLQAIDKKTQGQPYMPTPHQAKHLVNLMNKYCS